MKLPSITVLIVSKKVLLISLGTLVVLVLLTAGLAVTEAHQKAEDRQAAIQAQAAVASQNARNKQVADLKQQVASEHAGRVGACNYILQKSKTKPTAGLLTVPVVYCP